MRQLRLAIATRWGLLMSDSLAITTRIHSRWRLHVGACLILISGRLPTWRPRIHPSWRKWATCVMSGSLLISG